MRQVESEWPRRAPPVAESAAVPEAPLAQSRTPRRRPKPSASRFASTKESHERPCATRGLSLYCASALLREIGDDRPLDHEQRLLQGSLIEVEEGHLFRRILHHFIDDGRD